MSAKKTASPARASRHNPKTTATDSTAPGTTKIERIARILSQRSLNCFQAQAVGDSCLHSTIDKLRQAGFLIHDEWERVPSRFSDKPTRCKRYRVIQWPKGWRAGAWSPILHTPWPACAGLR